MRADKVIQIAWKGLAKNKMRSLLTMLGVIIGVAAVIIMIAVSAGTEKTIEEQITGLGSNLVFVQSSFSRGGFGRGGGPESEGGLVYDDAGAIAEHVPGVTGVVVEQPSAETVKAGNVTLDSVSILGTTPDFPSVRDMTIATGRYFSQQELDRKQKVAVLGASLAEELFGEAPPVGQTITVGSTKLTVIGVFDEKSLVGDVDYDMRLYTPITVVFQKFTPSQFARFMGDRVRLIYVEVDGETPLDDMILQIELLLARRHDVSLDEPDFTVTTQQDIIDTQAATTEAFRSLLAWVAAVSLLVGGIGIMNIMFASVMERIKEIGTRLAIGAQKRDIVVQFLAEAVLISVSGGLIGVFIGIMASWLITRFADIATIVTPISVVISFVVSASVGVIFGYSPAKRASERDPIESLRYE